MKSKAIFHACFILLIALSFSCGNSASDTKNQTDSATDPKDTGQQTQPTNTTSSATPAVEDGPSIAEVTTPNYVAKIHKAIIFTPKEDAGGSMFKVKEGHDKVVLDMSVKNTSAKELDMGQILLAATVTDDKGKKHALNLGSIAAYTYTFPNPGHQAQYDKLWNKIGPGEFYRTTAFGLEIPKGTKNFTMSLLEEGDVFNNKIPRHEMKFTIE